MAPRRTNRGDQNIRADNASAEIAPPCRLEIVRDISYGPKDPFLRGLDPFLRRLTSSFQSCINPKSSDHPQSGIHPKNDRQTRHNPICSPKGSPNPRASGKPGPIHIARQKHLLTPSQTTTKYPIRYCGGECDSHWLRNGMACAPCHWCSPSNMSCTKRSAAPCWS